MITRTEFENFMKEVYWLHISTDEVSRVEKKDIPVKIYETNSISDYGIVFDLNIKKEEAKKYADDVKIYLKNVLNMRLKKMCKFITMTILISILVFLQMLFLLMEE